jgi:hypothetical protein
MPDGDEETLLNEDAMLLGIVLPVLEIDESHFDLLRENAPVLEAFFVLDGCAWQYTSMGELIGLNYPAAQIIWQGLKMKINKDTFEGVMLFTKTVANEINKRLKNGQ